MALRLFLAGTYDDGLTKIWSAETGSCERCYGADFESFPVMLSVFQLVKRAPRTLDGTTSVVTAVAFGASGLSLVLGMMDGHVQLRSVTSGEVLREFRAHHAPVSAVACAPSGQLMATGSLDRTAIVWNFEAQAVKVFSGHAGSVTCMAFASDS